LYFDHRLFPSQCCKFSSCLSRNMTRSDFRKHLSSRQGKREEHFVKLEGIRVNFLFRTSLENLPASHSLTNTGHWHVYSKKLARRSHIRLPLRNNKKENCPSDCLSRLLSVLLSAHLFCDTRSATKRFVAFHWVGNKVFSQSIFETAWVSWEERQLVSARSCHSYRPRHTATLSQNAFLLHVNLWAPCVLYIGTGVSLLSRERFLYI